MKKKKIKSDVRECVRILLLIYRHKDKLHKFNSQQVVTIRRENAAVISIEF